MEATPSTQKSTKRSLKSELEKFKLFYEFATPTKEIRSQIQQQSERPVHGNH